MVLPATLLSFCVLAAFLRPRPVDADDFLGRTKEGGGARAKGELLAELEGALGAAHRRAAEARLGAFEDTLRPIVAALPKNRHGALSPPSARYALHRLFLQRHAWQVNGLYHAGEAWDGVSPTSALGGLMPDDVRSIFEARLADGGFDMNELAALAATIEHLVRNETGDRLRVTYRAMNHSVTGAPLSEREATAVIEAYMASYINGHALSGLTPKLVRKAAQTIHLSYHTWPDTQKFLREVRQEVAPRQYDFRSVSSVLETVGERYGRWQSSECLALKDQLLKIEDLNGTGRVRLSAFYASAFKDGNWQFSETSQYLRQLGVLDESDPEALRVIIPNYINGPSNCIAASDYYAVCCIDECEDLFGHLERQIGAPSATPHEIITHVSALPSATMPGNRTLPAALLRRLDEVAGHHGGRIPLHGRLFAQWMHYAYPRECQFPHVSGTTSPLHTAAWSKQTGSSPVASRNEMKWHIEAERTKSQATQEPMVEEGMCSAMWTTEEELVDAGSGQGAVGGSREGGAPFGVLRALLHGAALVGVAGSAGLGVLKILQQLSAAQPGDGKPAPALPRATRYSV